MRTEISANPEKINHLFILSGVVSTLIGLIAVFTVQRSDNYKILLIVAVSFLTILYAAIIAEFIVRPLKKQVHVMLSK
ncbi:MAG: uncharacterized membrane protein HdeD (DUF308 family) [Enterobacterales bacterium]|jgi:uncharacterized membrane protein HdeD (DUF308 family)